MLFLAVATTPRSGRVDAAEGSRRRRGPVASTPRRGRDSPPRRYLGPDFYQRTGYADELRARAAYRGMLQPPGQRCRFFPNATREPPGGAAPGVVAPATDRKKRKKRDGDSAKKDKSAKKSSKKKKRDSDAADGSSERKKKRKKDKKSM